MNEMAFYSDKTKSIAYLVVLVFVAISTEYVLYDTYVNQGLNFKLILYISMATLSFGIIILYLSLQVFRAKPRFTLYLDRIEYKGDIFSKSKKLPWGEIETVGLTEHIQSNSLFWLPIFKIKTAYLVLAYKGEGNRFLIPLNMLKNNREDILAQIKNYCISNKIAHLKFHDESTENKK